MNDGVVSINPELRCKLLREGEICGRPARAGVVKDEGGSYTLMPMCEECSRSMARVYGLKLGGQQQEEN